MKTTILKPTPFLFILLSILACSPEDGTNGLDGKHGADGSNGLDGADGINGLTSLIVTTAVEPGENCTNGGFRLDIGLDTNDNGQLEPGELTSSQYLCNTTPADGLNSLIGTMIEQPGPNCSNGGYRLDAGLDLNANGRLDGDEVTASEFLCNGESAEYPYQSYASLLSQSGTEDPLSTVVDNSLEMSIVWVRQAPGRYLGTMDRPIDISKTVIFYSTPTTHTGVRGELVSDNQIVLELQNGINILTDNFDNLSFELREYE